MPDLTHTLYILNLTPAAQEVSFSPEPFFRRVDLISRLREFLLAEILKHAQVSGDMQVEYEKCNCMVRDHYEHFDEVLQFAQEVSDVIGCEVELVTRQFDLKAAASVVFENIQEMMKSPS